MKYLTLIFLSLSLFGYSQTDSNAVAAFLENSVQQFPNVRDLALSPNKDEAFFTAQSYMGDVSVLINVKKLNGEWLEPKIASFSGEFFDLEPFLSPNGLTLFFVSNRPLDPNLKETKDFDIWYVTRKTTLEAWSEPINLGAPINTPMDEFYPAITNSGNLYFTLDNPELNQKDNIYISEFIDGSYQQPKQLSSSINSEGYEFNAFVSPDESVLIYTCYNKEGGLGSGDLYISHKLENGEWSPSENMGATINSDKMEYCPFVDVSNGILYFTSKRNTSNKIESVSSMPELMKIFKSYENGLSRLYQVNIENLLTQD